MVLEFSLTWKCICPLIYQYKAGIFFDQLSALFLLQFQFQFVCPCICQRSSFTWKKIISAFYLLIHRKEDRKWICQRINRWCRSKNWKFLSLTEVQEINDMASIRCWSNTIWLFSEVYEPTKENNYNWLIRGPHIKW